MRFIDEFDLASYLRVGAVEIESAGLILDLTNGVITDVVGELDPVPSRVKAIALEVAARAYRNPNGYASETIDDYTYRRDAETRQAGVYLTDSERVELTSMVAVIPAMFTVDLGTPWTY